ncbi:MAG: site-specific integrase [Bacteroidales bacterium]|nr:site-specific integrase [Bacteroidales bacterium]
MSQTFETVAAAWKAEKRQWVKPSSYSTYVQLLNVHLLPAFAEVPSEKEIQDFVNREIAAGLSRKTVQDTILVLKMILRYGEKGGLWPHVEFEVHYPSGTKTKPTIPVLSGREQKALHKYLEEHLSYRNLGLLICLNSGLRIGEMCGLQWKDLDLAARVIHVRKTVQRIYLADGPEKESYLSVTSPKTESSVRDIPIGRNLVEKIRQLKRTAQADNYLVSNTRKPLEPRYMRIYFRKVLDALKLPPVRFHALRHSFATRCIEAGCDYKAVSAILGHASISTTLNLYVHPDNAAKRKVIEKVGLAMRK